MPNMKKGVWGVGWNIWWKLWNYNKFVCHRITIFALLLKHYGGVYGGQNLPVIFLNNFFQLNLEESYFLFNEFYLKIIGLNFKNPWQNLQLLNIFKNSPFGWEFGGCEWSIDINRTYGLP